MYENFINELHRSFCDVPLQLQIQPNPYQANYRFHQRFDYESHIVQLETAEGMFSTVKSVLNLDYVYIR